MNGYKSEGFECENYQKEGKGHQVEIIYLTKQLLII
jgi:hypothetical protein